MIFYEQMEQNRHQLERQIAILQQKLKNFPPGRLICNKNGNYSKWYYKVDNSLTYLPKSERPLAEKLALKEFYFLQLQDLLKEKEVFDDSFKKNRNYSDASAKLIQPSSLYYELLEKQFQTKTNDLLKWAEEFYETNPVYPEQCVHKSCSGNKLRSKSEVMIDTELYTNKIPFRYECALHLPQKTIFPDFTIRHPKTGEYIYWEHFGMMNEAAYAKSAFEKLQLYHTYQIIPTVNLITTYETKTHPLDINYVHALIRHYFL